jgi:glycine betaine/proline transport system ATP-binding protein
MFTLTERTVNEYSQSPALLTDERLPSVLDALMAAESVDVVPRDRKKVGTISRQGLLAAIRSKLD